MAFGLQVHFGERMKAVDFCRCVSVSKRIQRDFPFRPQRPSAVRLIVLRRCELTGLEPGEVPAHSLRSGFLTEAGRPTSSRQAAHPPRRSERRGMPCAHRIRASPQP